MKKEADTVQLKLRFREDLRRKIKKAAAKNNMTMNGEIIARLMNSFQYESPLERLSAESIVAMVRELEKVKSELAMVYESGRLENEKKLRLVTK